MAKASCELQDNTSLSIHIDNVRTFFGEPELDSPAQKRGFELLGAITGAMTTRAAFEQSDYINVDQMLFMTIYPAEALNLAIALGQDDDAAEHQSFIGQIKNTLKSFALRSHDSDNLKQAKLEALLMIDLAVSNMMARG